MDKATETFEKVGDKVCTKEVNWTHPVINDTKKYIWGESCDTGTDAAVVCPNTDWW